MKKKTNRKRKPQRILFVDFNGVISYNPFWFSLINPNHPLHIYYEPIENLLFRGENKIKRLVDDWMMGKYTSEQIHKIIENKTGAPHQELLKVFYEDCKRLDISKPILRHIKTLRRNWYCILRSDNMDTLHRFTLPANPQLADAFDEIHSSFLLRQLKKTNGGIYFKTTTANFGIKIENCVLIDDSISNCILSESLGGKAYCTQNETEVIKVLKKLINPYVKYESKLI